MKIFIAYGILISLLFFAAGSRGFVLSSFLHQAKWGPAGQSQYHK